LSEVPKVVYNEKKGEEMDEDEKDIELLASERKDNGAGTDEKGDCGD